MGEVDDEYDGFAGLGAGRRLVMVPMITVVVGDAEGTSPAGCLMVAVGVRPAFGSATGRRVLHQAEGMSCFPTFKNWDLRQRRAAWHMQVVERRCDGPRADVGSGWANNLS